MSELIVRSWLVAQNEAAVLGDGWYGRVPDYYGLPCRESFPQASLLLPKVQRGDRITLLLASVMANYRDSQRVWIHYEGLTWEKQLLTGEDPWQRWTFELPFDPAPDQPFWQIPLRAEQWHHADFENNHDFRPVGILLAGVFVTSVR